MWKSTSGPRCVSGKFGKLVAYGIDELIDAIFERAECDEEVEVDVPPFDELVAEQKIFVLRLVSRALFLEDEPTPDLTAVSEGAIDAIFQYISYLTDFEVGAAQDDEDPGESATWRRLIFDALNEERVAEQARFQAKHPGEVWDAATLKDYTPPEIASVDLEGWLNAIDRLLEQLVPDTNCLCAAMFEMPKARRAEFTKRFGLIEDYYWRVYDEPGPEEARRMGEEIRDFCEEIIAKS